VGRERVHRRPAEARGAVATEAGAFIEVRREQTAQEPVSGVWHRRQRTAGVGHCDTQRGKPYKIKLCKTNAAACTSFSADMLPCGSVTMLSSSPPANEHPCFGNRCTRITYRRSGRRGLRQRPRYRRRRTASTGHRRGRRTREPRPPEPPRSPAPLAARRHGTTSATPRRRVGPVLLQIH
jgi:hypothetical protein